MVSLVPWAIALCCAVFFWWLRGDLLQFKLEEGIYLEGGAQILEGRLPYRDYFALTGPGEFWLHALVFKLFGVSFPVARLIPALALGVLTAACYALARVRAGNSAAGLCSAAFFLLTVWQPVLTANDHRWTSSALATAAVWAAFPLLDSTSRGRAVLSGVLSVVAAFFTPTVAICGLAVLAWLAVDRRARPNTWPWLAGAVATAIAAGGFLLASGSLGAFVDHMLWVQKHYSAANRISYAGVFDGLFDVVARAEGVARIVQLLVLAAFALPALLPLLNAAALATQLRRDRGWLFLFACATALVLSTWPRWDLTHLIQVAPLQYALFGAWMAGRRLLAVPLALAASTGLLLTFASLAQRFALPSITSARGMVRLLPDEERLARMLIQNVSPSDTLFAFPFMPVANFVTGARNPTRFPFLQPGMSPLEDELQCARELEQDPPEWILWFRMPDAAWLKSWPGSDPTRLHMDAIRRVIDERYRGTDSAPYGRGSVILLQRKDSASQAK